MSSIFLGFGIANDERKRRLLKLLNDDIHFNWERHTLTTVSKKDPLFEVVVGDYKGNYSWSGSVWTLTNYAVIQALQKAGFITEATRLAEKTIEAFKNNYSKFLHPFTVSGEGVKRYGWTAAQFIQILIEFIFGIKYDVSQGLQISPNIPKQYENEKFCINNLCLPDGKTYCITIENKEVTVQCSK